MIPDYLSSLANHLWQSTLFAGVAGLLALVLRKNRASVRYWLWMIASVKFLVPFSLLVSVGTRLDWRPASAIAPPEVVSVVQGISRPFTPPASTTPMASASPGSAAAAASVTPAPSRIPAVLFGVWLAGVAVVTFSWLREWRRIREVLKGASWLRLKIPVRAMSSPACIEPGVVGILRPVLLLPQGITDRLPAVQLDAILAHELCHVRRRDNLAAAIHMAVETVFWFHPLLWWIERRLVDERERACDEEVLRVVSEPQVYAEGILNVCKLYKASPVVCVSGVTGSNLKSRIEEIMKNRIARRLGAGRALLLAAAAIAAIVVPVGFGMVSAAQDSSKTSLLASPQAQAPAPAAPRGEPEVRNLLSAPARPAPQVAAPQAAPQPSPQSSNNPPKGSFVEEMVDAGYRNLDVDQLIAMKIHGVTGDYVRQIRAAGYEPTPDDIVAMKIHGVDPEYIRQIRAAGLQLTLDQLVAFRIHGVTADFMTELKQAGVAVADPDDLIALRIHGANANWIRQIQSLGFSNIAVEDLVSLRVHGITPDFITEARKIFKDLSLDQLIALKQFDILKIQ